MNTYDEYKLASPPEFNHPDKECSYCGEPSDKTFCSNSCRIAEIND